MTIAYKLTDKDGYTRRGKTGETLWSVGAVVEPTGSGTDPCGPGVLHAYVSPEVAVFADPVHGKYTAADRARLWKIRARGEWRTDGLKRWTREPVDVLEEVALPSITTEERIAFAICVAPHESTREWAVRWLDGSDRSVSAVARAAEAAGAAAAAEAAAWAAAAARATAWAAWAVAAGRELDLVKLAEKAKEARSK